MWGIKWTQKKGTKTAQSIPEVIIEMIISLPNFEPKIQQKFFNLVENNIF